jgi:hypothetical protein
MLIWLKKILLMIFLLPLFILVFSLSTYAQVYGGGSYGASQYNNNITAISPTPTVPPNGSGIISPTPTTQGILSGVLPKTGIFSIPFLINKTFLYGGFALIFAGLLFLVKAIRSRSIYFSLNKMKQRKDLKQKK